MTPAERLAERLRATTGTPLILVDRDDLAAVLAERKQAEQDRTALRGALVKCLESSSYKGEPCRCGACNNARAELAKVK